MFGRTYSSWTHEKGVRGKVVAQLMGHVKADQDAQRVHEVIDGALRAAIDKVGSELFSMFTIRNGRGADSLNDWLLR